MFSQLVGSAPTRGDVQTQGCSAAAFAEASAPWPGEVMDTPLVSTESAVRVRRKSTGRPFKRVPVQERLGYGAIPAFGCSTQEATGLDDNFGG